MRNVRVIRETRGRHSSPPSLSTGGEGGGGVIPVNPTFYVAEDGTTIYENEAGTGSYITETSA